MGCFLFESLLSGFFFSLLAFLFNLDQAIHDNRVVLLVAMDAELDDRVLILPHPFVDIRLL